MNWFRWGMNDDTLAVHVCTDVRLRCYAIKRSEVEIFDKMLDGLMSKGYQEKECPHTIGQEETR